MMMQMLEAGGLEILSDGKRQADDDNPKGYYELEAVKKTKDDPSWLNEAPGKAVKMISQLLQDLPTDRAYHIIFMRRDLTEILASQATMLERRGGGDSAEVDDEQMRAIFTKHLTEIIGWLKTQRQVRLLEVWHADTVARPTQVAGDVIKFLGLDLDRDRMAATVEGGLHRNRGTDAVSADDFMAVEDEEEVAKRLRDLGYL